MKKEINVQRYAFVILALLCFGIALPNFAQYQVSAFGSEIRDRMGLSPSQFSAICTAPLLPGIFLSLISGMLVDKLGARKVLLVSLLVTTLACVLRIFATGFWSMYVTMIFLGVTATFLNSNSGKLMGQWFSPEKMAVGMGIFLAFANASMGLGQGLAALFNGMRGAFIGAAVFAVVVFVFWIVFLKDKPSDGNQAEETLPVLESLKLAAKTPITWMAAVSMFLSVGGVTAILNFLPSALADRGFADGTANVISMAMTFGGLLGCLVCPGIVNRFKNRRPFFVAFGLLAALGFFFAWRVSNSAVVSFILLFFTGIFANGLSPMLMSMPVQDPRIGTRAGGTAGGFVATVQLGGSVVIPTYIIAPLATRADGSCNFLLYFGLMAIMMCLYVVLCFFLPLNKKKGA